MPLVPGLRWRILALANVQGGRRRLLIERRKKRAQLRATVDAVTDITDAEFIKTFRLGKAEVANLVLLLTPLLQCQRRKDAVSPHLKVLIALAFYATRSYQTLVGQSALHNVSQSTVSRAVRQVTEALNHQTIFKRNVVWPMEAQDRNKIKAQFYNHGHGIPGVLGCIDGTHVAILRPLHHEEIYFNRKGYHSLNVMIVCDADLNILCVDASSPGSAHDSSVWQSHPLFNHVKELWDAGERLFLLGDSGYPLRTTMMTPVLNTVEGTPDHHYYNLHVSTRNAVERCIGVLKARFRCLLAARALHYNPVTAGKIVNACCVLHNIANKNKIPVPPLTPEETLVERQHQHQMEREIRAALEQGLEEPSRRVNPDLHQGRIFQKYIIDRLWRNRSNLNI